MWPYCWQAQCRCWFTVPPVYLDYRAGNRPQLRKTVITDGLGRFLLPNAGLSKSSLTQRLKSIILKSIFIITFIFVQQCLFGPQETGSLPRMLACQRHPGNMEVIFEGDGWCSPLSTEGLSIKDVWIFRAIFDTPPPPWFALPLPSYILQQRNLRHTFPLKYSDVFYGWPLSRLLLPPPFKPNTWTYSRWLVENFYEILPTETRYLESRQR